jgi:hypothetical protein
MVIHMPSLEDQLEEFALLIDTPNLTAENLKKAANQLIDISKTLDEEIKANKENEDLVRAIGSISSITKNTFTQISDKPSDLYNAIQGSAKQALPKQAPIYSQLFKQVDVFRTKLIENSKHLPQKDKEEILEINKAYQQEKIFKSSLTEVTAMAEKIKRDMLDGQMKKDGWIDPVNTAQALKLLNDQFDSINKAVQKNPILSEKDKIDIAAKIQATKKSFRKTIAQL